MSQIEYQAYQHLLVQPLTGRIGAEIQGIKLSGELDKEVVAEINQALLQYKVIFFREQQHLTDLEQESFAALLGTPLNHPSVPVKDGTAHTLSIDSRGGRADSWHTDITFLENYPKATILRNVVAPEVGGDTVWANTTSAYEDLTLNYKHWPTSYVLYTAMTMIMRAMCLHTVVRSIRTCLEPQSKLKLSILLYECILNRARKP